jgi:hypothetical protein
MLRQSGLNFITADEMGEAARKVVAAAEGKAPPLEGAPRASKAATPAGAARRKK